MQIIPELPPDGERLITEFSGQIVHEHLHRYAVAKQYVADKDVLDIACGEGYGSNFLSQSAKTVVGVDISDLAVSHAQHKYSKANVTFKVGSCTAIPLLDASVDVVVSFETLEHFTDHELFLREVKRILRPDGLLIISSPDKRNYSDMPNYRNPFHLRELYHEEFKQLIHNNFTHSVFGKQIYYPCSVIELETPTAIADISGDYGTAIYNKLMEEAIYSFAFASDIKLPDVGSSLFHAQMDNTASTLVTVQLFDKSDQQFCEEKSIRLLAGKEQRCVLEFTHLERFLESGVLYLRLDPADIVCRVDLHSAVLKIQKPTGEIESKPLGTPTAFENLIEIEAGSKCYLSTSSDPQLYFNPIEVEPCSLISLTVDLTISSNLGFVGDHLSHLESALNQRIASSAELQNQISQRDTSIVKLQDQIVQRDAYIAELQNQLSQHETSIVKLQDQIVQRDAYGAKLQNQISQRDTSNAELQNQLAERACALLALQRQYLYSADKITRMQNSISWKLTAPLRAIRRFIFYKNHPQERSE